jgi:hypothetical protein
VATDVGKAQDLDIAGQHCLDFGNFILLLEAKTSCITMDLIFSGNP